MALEVEHDPDFMKRPKTLYGVLDQSEVLGDGTVAMTFGTVDGGTWFQNLIDTNSTTPRDPIARARFYATIPLFLLDIRVPISGISLFGEATSPSFMGVDAALQGLEGTWVRIDLDEDAGQPADLYFNLFAAPIPTYVSNVTPAGFRESILLDALDPLAEVEDSSVDEIVEALDLKSTIEELTIYDVGQGAANGLVGANEVQCYYDIGGGVAGNRATFPTKLRSFCRCMHPPIVLSHWDHDHWSSQGRVSGFRAHTWIVPRQHSASSKRAPHHSSLIAAIQKSGRLLVFPAKSTVSAGQLVISECTGSTKNSSGLALEINPRWTASGERPVLMTGDAGYGDLRRAVSQSPDFDAIVCPHHGGRSNSPTIPAPPSWTYQRLIYSYGPLNTYNHPLHRTYSDHDGANWFDARLTPPRGASIVRNTADRIKTSGLGHVGFDWTTSKPAKLACSGSTDLDAQQK